MRELGLESECHTALHSTIAQRVGSDTSAAVAAAENSSSFLVCSSASMVWNAISSIFVRLLAELLSPRVPCFVQ